MNTGETTRSQACEEGHAPGSSNTLLAQTNQHETEALKKMVAEVVNDSEDEVEYETYEQMPVGTQMLVDHLVTRILQQGFMAHSGIDEETLQVIAAEKRDPKAAAMRIKRATQRIRRWGKATKEASGKLHQTMVPEHLEEIIRPKNLALWKELAEYFGYTDKALWKNVAQGFDVIGTIERTGVWEPLEVAEDVTEEDIANYLHTSERLRLTRPSWMDDEILLEVQRDLRAGLLDGRYTEKEIHELQAPPSKCFGIRQANKIRAIIDQRGLNKVTGYVEKMRLMGTGRILSLMGAFAAPQGMEKQGLRNPGTQSAKEVHKQTERLVEDAKERLAQSMDNGRRTTWAAVQAAARISGSTRGRRKGLLPRLRCEDWKGAYHQFGAKQLWANCLIFWDDGMHKWRGIESNVLNMGNKLSVPNFCRISEFVRYVCIRMAGVVTSIYIDDGVIIHSEEARERLQQQIINMLELCQYRGGA